MKGQNLSFTAAIITADLSVRPSVRHVPMFCPDE